MEANPILERPPKVKTAVIMLYVSLGIVSARSVTEWSLPGNSIGLAEILTLLTLVPVFSCFYYIIWKGKNWARIIFLILMIANLPLSIFTLRQSLSQTPLSVSPQAFLILLDVVGTILDMAAVILLFQLDSSDWFKAMKKSRGVTSGINGPQTVLWESPGEWRPSGEDYKIKYSGQFFGIPKYGFLGKGTFSADSGMVRLSGQTARGVLFHVIFFPCAVGLFKLVNTGLGLGFSLYAFIGILVGVALLANWKWKILSGSSVYVEKRFIADEGRDGRNVAFSLPDPSGTGGPPVRVSIKAKSEEDATKIVDELKSLGPSLARPINP